MILNRGRYCPNGFTCVLPIAFVFLGLILSSSPCFNVMRMNSEKFPWHHFSSLYSERVRLDGLCSPFQYQPCPVPHSRPCAFHSTRCVYLLFQCFLNLLCLRSGWEPAFAPPLSASDLAILEEAWGAPT